MRAGLGLILTVITALLIIVFTAMPAHAQGIYVSPPPCWWSEQVNEPYIVLYDYGFEPYVAYVIYLMTPSEYQALSQGSSTYAINWWTLYPGDSLAIQVPSIGDYLVIVPSTGYCQGEPSIYEIAGQGAPIGVSSLDSVTTDKVLGYFNITAISAYNPNGESEFGVPNSGASLQLNVVLEVQLVNGVTQYYWLQNIVRFITSSNEYSISDSVWNDTGSVSILSNSTITGNGYVSPSINGSYYYSYATAFQHYSLPFAGYLLIKPVSTVPLEVSFCYVIIQNGSQFYPPNFNCYDTVTINTSVPVANAFITSQPDELTPHGTLMDVELVFGGYGNGEYTTFNTLNAYLSILYRFSTLMGNVWRIYTDLYINGWDTTESATDLTSEGLSSGLIYVTTGNLPNNYTFLSLPTVFLSPPSIPLPMTYVSIYDSATGESGSGYLTNQATFTFPTIVRVGSGTKYVLIGVYVNGTLQSGNTVTITPTGNFAIYNITASYSTYYLVTVTSEYPVSINGTETTHFSAWLSSDTVLSIAPATVFRNGVFMSEPGYTITISKPMSINVQWQVNWALTGAMYGGLATAIAIAAALITRSRKQPR